MLRGYCSYKKASMMQSFRHATRPVKQALRAARLGCSNFSISKQALILIGLSLASAVTAGTARHLGRGCIAPCALAGASTRRQADAR
jgi:hypothetical protein